MSGPALAVALKRGCLRGLAVLAACAATPWAAWHQRRISRSGRPLTAAEEVVARALGLADLRRICVREVGRVPNPLHPALWLLERCGAPCISRVDGITLGRGIYICRESAGSLGLVAHELVHVGQYQRAGSIRAFMVEYIHQCLLHGYFDAPWEVEARRKSAAAMRGE